MNLINSNNPNFPFSFELSDLEYQNIDSNFDDWCNTLLGNKGRDWTISNKKISINHPETALKFKLRWGLSEDNGL